MSDSDDASKEPVPPAASEDASKEPVPPAAESTTAADATPKAEVKKTITLTVADQTGAKTYFKVRDNTRFEKIFNAYSKRKGIERTSMRFTYEGERLQDTDTPAKLEMEENDQIDVFQEQTGGTI
jgi:small ubiquitin-related modifier